MATDIKLAKSLISPSGDTLQEHLDYIGMKQNELAERMGRPKEKINDIIKGREPITTETAYQLEKVLDIPASFWMNRENEYRQELYEIEQQEILEQQKSWASEFPLRELKKMGVLPDIRSTAKFVEPLLKFFGIASPEEWNRIYVDEEVSVAFRVSLAHTQSPQALSAWLRMGEVEAKKMDLPPFDKKRFRASLEPIKELAYEMPEGFERTLQEICMESGVALIYTPNLPKAPISGVSRWYLDTPLIQLSGRHKTDDHFWFTFFHEAGHILLHGKKDIFLEDLKGAENDQEKEEEADRFAAKWLLTEKELQRILDVENATYDDIRAFSDTFRTPGYIIGRLQHAEYIHYSEGNELKRKVELFKKNEFGV
ncbi:ImmA/IrrE family metallo-endopeptidase [soil metagenome]